MYYEINVSLNGSHFFATAPRSITSEEDLKIKYPVLKKKFPEDQGYFLTVCYYAETGKILSREQLQKL